MALRRSNSYGGGLRRSSSAMLRRTFTMGAGKSGVSLTMERTPLHFAAEENEGEAVLEHLDRGCEVDAVDEMGNTALHLAAHKGHAAIVKVLIQHRRAPLLRLPCPHVPE